MKPKPSEQALATARAILPDGDPKKVRAAAETIEANHPSLRSVLKNAGKKGVRSVEDWIEKNL